MCVLKPDGDVPRATSWESETQAIVDGTGRGSDGPFRSEEEGDVGASESIFYMLDAAFKVIVSTTLELEHS